MGGKKEQKKKRRSCLQHRSLRWQRHARRNLHRYALLLLAFLACYWGAKLYGTWSAQQLQVNHCTLPQEALPGTGPLRIAFLSDVHADTDLLEKCVEAVEAERPDLIVFGGDLGVATQRFSRSRKMIELLRLLPAVAPTYAIFGNQDYEMQPQVERVLATAGIRLLRNEGIDWQAPNGAPLRLVGLGDWNEGDENPARCMAPAGQEERPVLLLSHDPESRHLLQEYDWDLMLAGHTHGGQLGNPFTGACISFRSDMPGGTYEENGRHIFVTRGVGSILGMRFFCPPEMNFIQIGAAGD